MTNIGRDGTESRNVGNGKECSGAGECSDANKKITIYITNSKPRKEESHSRWPAIFISMIMILGIFAMMPVQAANPVTEIPTAGPAPVNLGTASDFVILAQTGITTTGVTAITGDIGVSPIASTAITGFGLVMDPSGEYSTTVPTTLVTGKVYAANYADPTPTKMGIAVGDMGTAYTDAAGRLIPDYFNLYSGDITGQTLTPGLWKWTTGLLISAAGVTISGAPNDVWIFQIDQDLTVANTAIITLDGGAQASNIFWQVAGQAVLGTTSQFKGIILCQTQIVIQNGASLEGRALAQTAVTTDANTITVPALSGLPPVSQVTTLVATPHTNGGADIQLEWDEIPDANVYNIYESSRVNGTGFNFASPTYSVPDDGEGKIIYQLAGKYSDANSYSWIVRAANGTEENTDVPATGGNMAYKLVKTLTIGTGGVNAGYNFISLPLRLNLTSGIDTNNAAALSDDMNAYGNPNNSIASIRRWNSDDGDWEIWTENGTNFALKAGEAYIITPTVASVIYKIVGAHNQSANTYDLKMGTGAIEAYNNYISLPYHCSLATSQTLIGSIRTAGSPIKSVSSVNRWNQGWRMWESRCAFAGRIYAISPGEACRAVVTAPNVAWTCPVQTPSI